MSGNKRNPATGRKMREGVNKPGWKPGGGPKRNNGSIVHKGRLTWSRQQRTK